jgi:hypothetical protein
VVVWEALRWLHSHEMRSCRIISPRSDLRPQTGFLIKTLMPFRQRAALESETPRSIELPVGNPAISPDRVLESISLKGCDVTFVNWSIA